MTETENGYKDRRRFGAEKKAPLRVKHMADAEDRRGLQAAMPWLRPRNHDAAKKGRKECERDRKTKQTMSFSFVPKYAFRKFTDISPDFLIEHGVRFLMLDLDNTIAKYSEFYPADSALKWVANLKFNNIKLFFISNNRRKHRVDSFAKALGIGFINGARKPSPNSLLQAMKESGFETDESALLGDQIFTDTLAANRAGVISIIVRPLSMLNPVLSIRFAIEAPFRAACARKMPGSSDQ